MIYEITIETYFEEPKRALSFSDSLKLKELRDSINSYQTVREQIKFIENWRSNKANKNFDMRVLDISPSASIDKKLLSKIEIKNEINKYWNNRIKNLEYLETKSFKGSGLGSWFQEHNFEGLGKVLNNISTNIILYLKILIIIIVIIIIINIAIFLYGYINSFGATPFIFSYVKKEIIL